MEEYKLTVGLEIHAELKTRTKMFCDCLNDPNETHPNVNICPVCMGHPGTLPVINKEAVKDVLLVGLALGGQIAEESRFDRKNYFYPDLPKGYQISQYKHPFVEGGTLELPGFEKVVRITRVHLEEDAGKLLHEKKDSLIDYNRADVPLMELVTEPDIASAEEAKIFAEELQLLLRYLGVSEANMEKGQMRIEANISISKDPTALGTKVEVKNINSFRAVEKAIEYEYKRQMELLDDGKTIAQETRGWDDSKQATFSQRSKEEAHDYRYFPDPDLPPLNLKKDRSFDPELIKGSMPELPWQKRYRFNSEYKISKEASEMMVRDPALADYFERVVSEVLEWADKNDRDQLARLVANYLTTDLQSIVKEKEATFSDILITPENFAELVKMIHSGEISSRVAKDVLLEMFSTGADPSDIVEQKGLKQVGDESALRSVAAQVILDNPAAAADYRGGKEASLQFLVGQMMRLTRGAANPQMAAKLLKDQININK